MNKGKIITIEGTDGSGKATQAEILVRRLRREDVNCESMSFPRYETPTGRIISQCYLGKKKKKEDGDVAWFGEAERLDPKVAALLYAADRQAARGEILNIIDSQKHLVIDRYVESNMAHQASKKRDQKGINEVIRFIEKLEYGLLDLPRPGLTILLYIPYEVSMELKGNQTEPDGHERSIRHMRQTELVYPKLAKEYGWKRIDCAPDGTRKSLRTKEDIAREVYSHVRALNLTFSQG